MTGVSTQTVSRVINKRPDVSPQTREAVEAAIAETGFQPSAVARSLVHRRSQTLGVIVAGLRYFGVAQTLNGITEEAQAAGYGVLLKEIDSSETVDIGAGLRLHDRAPGRGHHRRGPADRRQHRHGPGPASQHVAADRVPQVGAVARVRDHRHRQPGRGTPRDRAPARAGPTPDRPSRGAGRVARGRGPRGGLARCPARPQASNQDPWPPARGRPRAGSSAFEELIARDPRIDGVFVANDQMALGVLRAAGQLGIRVPDDVAVVGFDGLDEGAQFTPSLTTVVQPLRELGELAVRGAIAATNGGAGAAAARSQVLATELVIRESAPAIS